MKGKIFSFSSGTQLFQLGDYLEDRLIDLEVADSVHLVAERQQLLI
jgi:hypothetical protein